MEIKELLLQTANPTALAKFYGDQVGLNVKQDNDLSVSINAGSSTLVFSPTAEEATYHFAFDIPANKIVAAHDWLRQVADPIWIEQYNSTIADFVNWNAKSVYFFDPAGNIVELIARMDRNIIMDEPFSAQQILSISEAGIVFDEDEYEGKVRQLKTDYHLDNFSKQPPLPQFRALGDDNGLFIVVPANRNWFPTTTPSGVFPMEVRFINKGERFTFKNQRR